MTQNTLKFGQKHHFYATILARRRQNGLRRSQDPDVSIGMPLKHVLMVSLKLAPHLPWIERGKFRDPLYLSSGKRRWLNLERLRHALGENMIKGEPKTTDTET